MDAHMKKLYRSRTSRIASGVFGGLGEWMEVNPNILRIGYIIIAIITSIIPALVIYAVAHFLIPTEEEQIKERNKQKHPH